MQVKCHSWPAPTDIFYLDRSNYWYVPNFDGSSNQFQQFDFIFNVDTRKGLLLCTPNMP